MWNIIEVHAHGLQEDELNMSLGSKFKMSLNFSDNLTKYPNVMDPYKMDDLTESIEVEFDPTEPQVFFFSTSEGLFRMDNRLQDANPTKMDTLGLNSPTALSMSDKGYLLAAYSCGSIT